MSEKPQVLTGILLDETIEISLGDICRICEVHAEEIIEMVNEGVLTPRGQAPETWRFSGTALHRARRALRLQRDLQVNLAGAALALDLMEELEGLRARLRALDLDSR